MKIIKIILVSIFLVLFIFLAGAFILPKKQHFTETKTLKTDPVAVFTHLIDTARVEKIFNEVLSDHSISVHLKEKQEYSEVIYLISMDEKKKPVEAAFILNGENEGTEITAYIKVDSLNYPYGRWRGFFIPIIYKNSATNFINRLETVIMR